MWLSIHGLAAHSKAKEELDTFHARVTFMGHESVHDQATMPKPLTVEIAKKRYFLEISASSLRDLSGQKLTSIGDKPNFPRSARSSSLLT
jgi:hypothetical protein